MANEASSATRSIVVHAAKLPVPGKSRGALSRLQGRFETLAREAFDDGWGAGDEAPRAIETSVTEERACSIIQRNDSPDLPFELSINPYRGCEFACRYCYARYTHEFLELTPEDC